MCQDTYASCENTSLHLNKSLDEKKRQKTALLRENSRLLLEERELIVHLKKKKNKNNYDNNNAIFSICTPADLFMRWKTFWLLLCSPGLRKKKQKSSSKLFLTRSSVDSHQKTLKVKDDGKQRQRIIVAKPKKRKSVDVHLTCLHT
ncbi:hypothetical protein JOB18_010169 [Solea senegalensis]|uniref:Shugoshin C-terminal domain-containing protein n=1 Tax=Solea senegalensis TaxID=28829 RepID=A0AAV6QV45_SOLSE|nr:hypothetical protein JOB18_010169 [Solea senegalensis]